MGSGGEESGGEGEKGVSGEKMQGEIAYLHR